MRVFVTGATGFIGGHLCRRLVAEGHAVTALVRTPAKAEQLEQLGVTLLHGDLASLADPTLVLPEQEVVVHLAGVVAAPSPEVYEHINHGAVVDLLGALARQSWSPARLVFASSLAAAGPSPVGSPWTEEDPLAPVDPYGSAKARAESALARAPFPVTVIRPPIVLGPGDPAFLTLFRAARSGLGVRVAGPAQRLSWVYVEDLVDAFVRAAEDERTGHFTYYASSPEQIDTDLLWAALEAAMERRIRVVPVHRAVLSAAASIAVLVSGWLGLHNQLDHKQVAQMSAAAWQCDGTRLREELGWSPAWGFEDAVHATARGYAGLGWL